MHVYVVTEHTPVETFVLGVHVKKADAIALVNRRFDNELDGYPDVPEEFAWTDHNGGCLGDCSAERGWVYWNITPKEVY